MFGTFDQLLKTVIISNTSDLVQDIVTSKNLSF